MTTKKYILIYLIFITLLLISVISFLSGLSTEDGKLLIKSKSLIISLVSFIFSILTIVINYKRIVAYDIKRIKKKVENIDFITINNVVTYNDCFVELLSKGYKRLSNELFYKEDTNSANDVDVIYYSKIININGIINIEECLEGFKKGINYNIGYIFVNDNIKENLNIVREYIKEVIVDVESHAYGYKVFFVPIIITNDNIYYIEAGSYFGKYRQALLSGISFINKIIYNR